MYLDYSNTNIPQPDKFSIERRSALSEKKAKHTKESRAEMSCPSYVHIDFQMS